MIFRFASRTAHSARAIVVSISLAVTVGGAYGCIGSIGDRGNVSSSGDAGMRRDGAVSGPSFSPIRRLTRAEYNNTVHDLLGDNTQPSQTFPVEDIQTGFTNNANSQTTSELLIEDYEGAAVNLATTAVTDLPGLLQCDPVSRGQDTCVMHFIPAFGQRAFRRPLEADEVQRYVTFYQTAKTAYDFSTAVRLIVQAMLQSPYFLYRVELGGDVVHMEMAANGTPITTHRVTNYQLASRLSYLLWSSMPDDQLLQAAASGGLDSATGIEVQARRLLADPRSARSLNTFFSEWFYIAGLDTIPKDPTLFPGFTPAIRTLLGREESMFLSDVVTSGDISTLISGSYSYMNADLARYYGVSGPTGDTFERVNLDPARHAGILTQGAFLAAYAHNDQTSPVRRGLFVLSHLLCIPIDQPPPGVNTMPPDIGATPNLTTRQRFEMIHEVGTCASCHHRMDSIGFMFENYDAIGTWRDQDAHQPINAAVTLSDFPGLNAQYSGAADFLRAVPTSPQFQSCLTRQIFRFGNGRTEGSNDQAALAQLQVSFGQHPRDFRELIIALTQTDAFVTRTEGDSAP